MMAERMEHSLPSAEQNGTARAVYDRLRPAFIPNAGQTDPKVRYYTKGSGHAFYFTREAAVFGFYKKRSGQDHPAALKPHPPVRGPSPDDEAPLEGLAVYQQFIGANPHVKIEGRHEQPGTLNFFTGNDSSKWKTGLHPCEEIIYKELWPGIDLVFRHRSGKLKYDLILQPGSRIERIRMAYHGVEGITLDQAGNLLITAAMETLVDEKPYGYQEIEGERVPVETGFMLYSQADGEIVLGFSAEAYDPRYPLVIDPGLVYSTFLGGSNYDYGRYIAVDCAGNAYVAGWTDSSDFPAAPGAFQISLKGYNDAFVSKLNSDGSALVYSTFLGGTRTDAGYAIAVDNAGNAYVTGRTESADFPITPGAFQTSLKGVQDTFVSKLSSDGGSLVYSTFLGGSHYDYGYGIAVDNSGNAYVTGSTDSGDFPTTPGAFQTSQTGEIDAFVGKLSPDGKALVYSTFLGGSREDKGYGIAVDGHRNAYVTGQTYSADFPTTSGAFQTSLKGVQNAFVCKLNPDGSALVYSTYMGGSSYDEGYGIAVDRAKSAYITGITQSADFPATPGAFQTAPKGAHDAFISKLNPDGSALVYSTFLGGSRADKGYGIAIDRAGSAYVTGSTDSGDFPTTPGAFQTSLKGVNNAFISALSPEGGHLVYSPFLGGSNYGYGFSIAVTGAGIACVAGWTDSSDFPTTPGAFQTSLKGHTDAFVCKFYFGNPCMSVVPSAYDFGPEYVQTASRPAWFTVANKGAGDLVLGTIVIAGPHAASFIIQNDHCSGQTLKPGESSTLSVVFFPAEDCYKSAFLTIPSNDPKCREYIVSLMGRGVPPVICGEASPA